MKISLDEIKHLYFIRNDHNWIDVLWEAAIKSMDNAGEIVGLIDKTGRAQKYLEEVSAHKMSTDYGAVHFVGVDDDGKGWRVELYS